MEHIIHGIDGWWDILPYSIKARYFQLINKPGYKVYKKDINRFYYKVDPFSFTNEIKLSNLWENETFDTFADYPNYFYTPIAIKSYSDSLNSFNPGIDASKIASYFENLDRRDPYLVTAVSEYLNSNDCSFIKITNIPDGINWAIYIYNDIEYIEQPHIIYDGSRTTIDPPYRGCRKISTITV